MTGTKPKPDYVATVDVWGGTSRSTRRLLTALSTRSTGALAVSFHPTGLADFPSPTPTGAPTVRHPRGAVTRTATSSLSTTPRAYDPFHYQLEKVKGTLDIQHDHWEFRKFQASHGEGMFYTAGRSRGAADGKEHVEVAIAGRGVKLDADLQNALREDMQRTWDTFKPEGTVDFDGTLHILPGEAKDPAREPMPDITLTVLPQLPGDAAVLRLHTFRIVREGTLREGSRRAGKHHARATRRPRCASIGGSCNCGRAEASRPTWCICTVIRWWRTARS